MERDSDSFYEEKSENEQEVAAPLKIQVKVNLESPESPPPASPSSSPVLPPPPIPEDVLAPVWELSDDGNDFMNCYTRTDVLELKNWAQQTRGRKSEER